MKHFFPKSALGTLLLLLALTAVRAQVYSKVGTANRNILNAKESRAGLVGEPYLFRDFKKAAVKFAGGTSSPGFYEIKYDQLEELVVTKGKDAEDELTFSDPVAEFKFDDSGRLFRNGYNAVDKSTEKSFYEVIYDGKTQYLKRLTKVIIEAKEYNVATVTKKIENETALYIAKADKKPIAVKANEKTVLKALGKEAEISKYIKDNKLNLKSDADMIKLLTYYDTL